MGLVEARVRVGQGGRRGPRAARGAGRAADYDHLQQKGCSLNMGRVMANKVQPATRKCSGDR